MGRRPIPGTSPRRSSAGRLHPVILASSALALLAVGFAAGLLWADFRAPRAESVGAPSGPTPAATTSYAPATPSISASAPATPTTPDLSALKLSLKNGPWKTSHVQGIAVDSTRGFIYYSFTTLLVKTDLDGKLIGTVGGFTGHLGDLDFNPANGRVYGSLEYNDALATYVAIFDVDKIDRVGMRAQNSDIVSTVYLPEVVDDYKADLDKNGRFAGDRGDTLDHRYGCSGIDGVAFGPKFGSTDPALYLTVAYGIYGNDTRTDNDHQVLLQYDITEWAKYEQPLIEGKAHHSGPSAVSGKYFIYTGNTHFGVQSLDYDSWLNLWFLAVYPGSKPQFPNYSLFAVDASATPVLKALHGLSGEKGLEIPLASGGLKDSKTGIRGWRENVPYGIQSLGNGVFYVVSSKQSNGSSSSVVSMEQWTGDTSSPFKPVKRKSGA